MIHMNLSGYQGFVEIEQIEKIKESKKQADFWHLSKCYIQNLYWQKSKVRNLKNSKWSVYLTLMAWGTIGSVIKLIDCRNLTIHVFFSETPHRSLDIGITMNRHNYGFTTFKMFDDVCYHFDREGQVSADCSHSSAKAQSVTIRCQWRIHFHIQAKSLGKGRC